MATKQATKPAEKTQKAGSKATSGTTGKKREAVKTYQRHTMSINALKASNIPE
jgi:hypothetical protein